MPDVFFFGDPILDLAGEKTDERGHGWLPAIGENTKGQKAGQRASE